MNKYKQKKNIFIIDWGNTDLNFIVNQRDKLFQLAYQYILPGRKMLVA